MTVQDFEQFFGSDLEDVNELIEVEFAFAVLLFCAWLLGTVCLQLEIARQVPDNLEVSKPGPSREPDYLDFDSLVLSFVVTVKVTHALRYHSHTLHFTIVGNNHISRSVEVTVQ